MELKKNEPVNLTAEINDTFYREVNSVHVDYNELWDLLRLEASLNFKPTTDFITYAECAPIVKFIAVRYNYQITYFKNQRIIINLN